MEMETPEKKLVSFTVNVICGEGHEKKLPSPARFLELNGIKEPEDISDLTRYSLTGRKSMMLELLKVNYNKSEEESEFIAKTYSEALYQFVMLAVNYNS